MKRNTTIRFLSFFLFLLSLGALLFLLPGAVKAQQPTPSDDEVNAIARQLYCPVCENIPLDVCPTQACHQWRELIRQMLAEGRTEAEIKQYFVDNYGARVLSEPPRQGLNWLVYVVPPILFLAGAYALYRAFRMWRTAPQEAAPKPDTGSGVAAAATVDDKYIARIEAELKKRQ